MGSLVGYMGRYWDYDLCLFKHAQIPQKNSADRGIFRHCESNTQEFIVGIEERRHI